MNNTSLMKPIWFEAPISIIQELVLKPARKQLILPDMLATFLGESCSSIRLRSFLNCFAVKFFSKSIFFKMVHIHSICTVSTCSIIPITSVPISVSILLSLPISGELEVRWIPNQLVALLFSMTSKMTKITLKVVLPCPYIVAVPWENIAHARSWSFSFFVMWLHHWFLHQIMSMSHQCYCYKSWRFSFFIVWFSMWHLHSHVQMCILTFLMNYQGICLIYSRYVWDH